MLMLGTKILEKSITKKIALIPQGPFYIVTSSVENNCKMPSGKIDTEHQCQNNLGVYKLNRYKEEFKGIVMVPMDIQNLKVIFNVLSLLWQSLFFL